MPFNPSIDKRIAKQKLDRIVEELRGEKLYLTCGKHSYVAWVKNNTVKPPQPIGCPDCWKAYYFTLHALTTPDMRQEHLDELEDVIYHTVEYAQKGKFGDDFELFDPRDTRFKVEVERDAADDETGADKIINPEEEKLN